MKSNGRPPGIAEELERSRPIALPVAAYTRAQIDEKWIVWQGQVYCIGTMYSTGYEKMVRSHVTNQFMRHILLDGIDDWSDSYSRYYTAMELYQRRKIRLYDSRQEAEAALREAAA